MSFFAKWFGKPSKKAGASAEAPASLFASSLHSVQHLPPAGHGSAPPRLSVAAAQDAESAPRPGERSARREMVYSSVRESMVRSGILSSGYKFKVLALDKRATQFIVMIDLAEQYFASSDKLAQIEALMAYSAKSRFDILVTSVYWRLNGQLGVAVQKRPAPAVVPPQQPVVASPVAQAPSGMDPVEEAEIAAFKKALLEAAARPVPSLEGDAAAKAAARVAPRPAAIVPPRDAAQNAQLARDAARQGGVPAPTPETNFGGLSNTQYGDLH